MTDAPQNRPERRHPRRAARAEGGAANGRVVNALDGREPASPPRAWRTARRAACVALAGAHRLRGARPGAAADRSVRPDQHPAGRPPRLQRISRSGHGRHHGGQRADRPQCRQHPVARPRGDRGRLDGRENRHVRHLLDVGAHRAGDRPVDPVGDAPLLRHADPRRGVHLSRHDCRRRQLAALVLSVRHRARRPDRARESRPHADHRPVRCVGRHELGRAVCRARRRGEHAHRRHVDEPLHFSLSGRHLRRHVRPGHLGADGAPDSHVRRTDDDSVARLRADGVPLLGLVPVDDHLRALRRDLPARSCACS